MEGEGETVAEAVVETATDAVAETIETVVETAVEETEEARETAAAIARAAIELEAQRAHNERFEALERGISECLTTTEAMEARIWERFQAELEALASHLSNAHGDALQALRTAILEEVAATASPPSIPPISSMTAPDQVPTPEPVPEPVKEPQAAPLRRNRLF